jgi:hypothetical protein
VRWRGDLREVVRRAATASGTTLEELCSRSHRPPCVRGRRIALVAGVWLLRREAKHLAALLGISGPSASRLLRRGHDVLPEALALAASLRASLHDGASAQERLLR